MSDGAVPERRRRERGEARQELLDVARSLFSQQGYPGTTTRQIADESGVSEPLIFRYFGNKSGLFDAAMLEPYRQFMEDFRQRWAEDLQRPEQADALTERFITGLVKLMRKERRLFLALIAARAFEGAELADGFAESDMSIELDLFDKMLKETTPLPPKYLDSEVSFRLIAGAVMACAVLDDWLFPSGPRRPSDSRITKELVQFCLYGVAGRRPRETS